MSQCLKDLKAEGISYEIVFIEASDQALHITRKRAASGPCTRPHQPGHRRRTKRLASLGRKNGFIIDTSDPLKTKQLKEILVSAMRTAENMTVTVVVVGFSAACPADAGHRRRCTLPAQSVYR